MSEHMPEPWSLEGHSRIPGVAVNGVVRREDAERIVASVNACVGSKTQDLKHYASLGGVEKIMSLLEQDRDELRSALKLALKALPFSTHPDAFEAVQIIEKLIKVDQ